MGKKSDIIKGSRREKRSGFQNCRIFDLLQDGRQTMKQVRILIIGILILPGRIFSLDLTVKGGAGNWAFDKDSIVSRGSAAEKFETNWYPFGLIGISGEYSDLISYGAAFERDPILRNRITTDFGLSFSFIRLHVGPFMGVLNSWDRIITPGISAGLTLEWPGILFGTVRAGSTLGVGLDDPGDYTQETGELALGFWLPHVIGTLSVDYKRYREQSNIVLATWDERLRYQFAADVFSKNVPFTVYINMGYQVLKRSYRELFLSDTDTLKSVFLGLETTVTLNPFLKILLGGEMPVYSWAEAPMRNPGKASPVFQAHTGIIVSFPPGK
jgi:hypothetical protein